MTLVLYHNKGDLSDLAQHVTSLLGPVVQPDTPYDVDTISWIWNNPQEHDTALLQEIVSDSEEGQSPAVSSTVLDSPPLTIPELENVEPVQVPHRLGGLCLEVSPVCGQHAFHSHWRQRESYLVGTSQVCRKFLNNLSSPTHQSTQWKHFEQNPWVLFKRTHQITQWVLSE